MSQNDTGGASKKRRKQLNIITVNNAVRQQNIIFLNRTWLLLQHGWNFFQMSRVQQSISQVVLSSNVNKTFLPFYLVIMKLLIRHYVWTDCLVNL